MAVDRLGVDGVVFLLLTGFPDDLNGFHAVVFLVAPVHHPHLVEVLHVRDVHGVSIRHDDLARTSAGRQVASFVWLSLRLAYIDDDHLDIADDEHAVFVGLRDVDVTIGDGDGAAPAAVDALGSANVVLCTQRSTSSACIPS